MKVIFIAGPFRGNGTEEDKASNIENARRFVKIFIENKIPFYSPHLNLDQEAMSVGESVEEHVITTNHEFLERCDALAVLPGWENSSGTKEEIEITKKQDKKIFYLEAGNALEEIKKFINE